MASASPAKVVTSKLPPLPDEVMVAIFQLVARGSEGSQTLLTVIPCVSLGACVRFPSISMREIPPPPPHKHATLHLPSAVFVNLCLR